MRRYFIQLSCSLLSLTLLLWVGILTASAQQGQTQTTYPIFIPGVFKNQASTYSISGQVFNPQNVPLAGITVRTNQGQAAITDLNGAYTFTGLAGGEYVVTPSFGSVQFSPVSARVVVPPDVTRLNFTTQSACSEALVNGSFEGNTGWEIPDTAYDAGYSSAEAHSGSRSMRTGIVDPHDNVPSYSSVHQKVSLPAGTANAYLTLWMKSFSAETNGISVGSMPQIGLQADEFTLSGDVQYLLVLDKDMKIVKTLLWQLSDSRSWTQVQFNLNAFSGQTIWLHFGTYNDGLNGISSMYIDDVSLDICPGNATPTPGPCTNLFHNPGFESTGDWQIP
ncbi:MAG: carboxypeptidase-like regulatory domain-containing protein, partial [Acidobacteriaceae bacterium]